jgi:hypothetical protein
VAVREHARHGAVAPREDTRQGRRAKTRARGAARDRAAVRAHDDAARGDLRRRDLVRREPPRDPPREVARPGVIAADAVGDRGQASGEGPFSNLQRLPGEHVGHPQLIDPAALAARVEAKAQRQAISGADVDRHLLAARERDRAGDGLSRQRLDCRGECEQQGGGGEHGDAP